MVTERLITIRRPVFMLIIDGAPHTRCMAIKAALKGLIRGGAGAAHSFDDIEARIRTLLDPQTNGATRFRNETGIPNGDPISFDDVDIAEVDAAP